MSEAFVLPQIQQLNTTSTIMSTLAFYFIALLIGFVLGYITKDLLTIEKQVQVTVRKQKIKGDNNAFDNDFDIDVEQEEKKPRRKIFNIFKRNK